MLPIEIKWNKPRIVKGEDNYLYQNLALDPLTVDITVILQANLPIQDYTKKKKKINKNTRNRLQMGSSRAQNKREGSDQKINKKNWKGKN